MSEGVPPTGRLALVNGRVILPDRVVSDRTVVVEAGKILGLAERDSLGSEVEQLDVGGRYITPGLIDIHTHGALGHTFNEPTAEAFAAITQENAARGVTALLAALATAPIPDLVACLEFSRQWMAEAREGARVLGVHVEGPYFSPEQCGAQDPRHMRTPDDGTADRLLEYRDVITIMTLAPELPGALALVSRLASLGIVPAAGHSSAQDTHVMAALEAGLKHIIHLWSGQSTTFREGPWRRPGLLEASLVLEGVTGEIIADNKHLPPTLMKLAYKCLGPDRLCIVSDATSGAGLPEGARFVMGQMEYEVHDGVGMMLDRTAFAGSTSLLNQMIPVLTRVVGVPLVEAVRMATLTPARVVGLEDRRGSLVAGKEADLAVFDPDFTTWRTMIGGRWA